VELDLVSDGPFELARGAMVPRRMYFCVCVSVANQRSTWLSHDAEVGVK
jgi:hypothetical protein